MSDYRPVIRVIDRALQDHGYLSEANVAILAREEEFRLCPVLARFSCCRFTAPAQDIEFLVETVLLRQQRYLYLRDLYIHEDELRRRRRMLEDRALEGRR